MKHIFLITKNEELNQSLKRYLHYVHALELTTIYLPAQTSALKIFHCVADALEANSYQESEENALLNAIAILDFCDPDWHGTLRDLNPLQERGFPTAVAMLILAFPEIHWVFFSPYKSEEKSNSNSPFFDKVHTLKNAENLTEILKLNEAQFSPLFDPTDLRNAIRKKAKEMKDENGNPIAPYIPERADISAAIDEEISYSYFNAYTAYRFGFRSHIITTYRMMEECFGENADANITPNLLFEDLYLNFPDKPGGVHLSNLKVRDGKFPKLKEANYRIFITIGHKQATNPETPQENREYKMDLRSNGKKIKTLYKPLAGVYDLWNRSSLRRWLRKGLGENFKWPPKMSESGEMGGGGHSAPGHLLEIGNRLINRSEEILHKTKTVPGAIHGALLASEAQEILGNRTPTAALEALSLKHQLEVKAECMFYGMEYNFDVKSRFKEIKNEVNSLGNWSYRKTRKLSKLNAEVGIINEIVQWFREYNQFDEEQCCLNRSRSLCRKIWFYKNKSWAWLFYPIRWYVEWLLGSLGRFVLAMLLWLVVLGFLYYFFAHKGIYYAITTFLSTGPPDDLSDLVKENTVWITVGSIIVSFIHLGIFISHLYSIIQRR